MIDGATYTLGYSVDPAGNVTGLTYPDGYTLQLVCDERNGLTYGYDSMNRLTSAQVPGESGTSAQRSNCYVLTWDPWQPGKPTSTGEGDAQPGGGPEDDTQGWTAP